jgi:hypothetical protein
MPNSDYVRDFHAWANKQAALLRAGEFAAADIEHIAEEIESLGQTETRELVNCVGALQLHLLRWRYQPKRRNGNSQASIKLRRLNLAKHLQGNPSLKARLPEAIEDAFGWAAAKVAEEARLSESDLPSTCPWSFEEMMRGDFWPN